MYTFIKVAGIFGVTYIVLCMVTKKEPVRNPVLRSVQTVNQPFEANLPISVATPRS